MTKTTFYIFAYSLFCRHYRPARVETPSHTGGISKEARDRLVERMQKKKDRSVLQASSKDKERKKERDYDDRNYDRHRHSRSKERGLHDRGKEGVVCFAISYS
jgi:pre-mRNA-splicing factor ATP-dependent RNA helicase DHX38/PRP16